MRSIVLAIVVALGLAGCGLIGAGGRGVSSTSCENIISNARCNEQAAKVAARHPGAVSVDLVCAGVCDRAHGTGTATVTMPDGSTVHDTFAYVGGQAVVPAPICKGVPAVQCQEAATQIADDTGLVAPIVAITVTCVAKVPCTPQAGEVTIDVTFADGTRESSGYGWASS
jgi:hypothetical protein